MKTTTLILSAIIATLPFVGRAENISGAMYVAPARATNLTPAPTTSAYPAFGRINIDTDDQEHIATTAYVKGAYNSAIAAVNRSYDLQNERLDDKQQQLRNTDTSEDINNVVFGIASVDTMLSAIDEGNMSQQDLDQLQITLISTAGVITGIKSQRAEIYTTWGVDDGTATTLVPFVTAQQ